MAESTHRFCFAPGVRTIQRDEGCVQFGADATRVGIIETEQPDTLASALDKLPRVFSRADFSAAAKPAGLLHSAAHSLFDDLLAYGIVRSAAPNPVIVLGASPLATMLRNALAESNFVVRSPLPGEPEETYLGMQNAYDQNIPVVVVDRLAQATTMAPMLLSLARTWVPVSLVDATGIIGPVHVDGLGPCPLCAELHRTDRDPTWHAAAQGISREQPTTGHHFPTAAAHATIAHVIVTLESLCGLSPPPGAPPHRVHPGQFSELDPYVRPQHRVVDNHPRCPECFMHTGGQYPINPGQTAGLSFGQFR